MNEKQKIANQIKSKFPHLEVWLCGDWIWISGTEKDDIPVRELLKELKFRWSSNKKRWYLKGSPSVSFNGFQASWEYIRNKHYSKEVEVTI